MRGPVREGGACLGGVRLVDLCHALQEMSLQRHRQADLFGGLQSVLLRFVQAGAEGGTKGLEMPDLFFAPTLAAGWWRWGV